MGQISQGMFYHITNFFAFGLSVLVFGISSIIHQQIVATLRGHLRFVYRHTDYSLNGMQETLQNYEFSTVKNVRYPIFSEKSAKFRQKYGAFMAFRHLKTSFFV